ncbi:hypothetical protein GCM10027563_22710 [Parasphingorhabdus pacifica]
MASACTGTTAPSVAAPATNTAASRARILIKKLPNPWARRAPIKVPTVGCDLRHRKRPSVYARAAERRRARELPVTITPRAVPAAPGCPVADPNRSIGAISEQLFGGIGHRDRRRFYAAGSCASS